MAAKSSRGINEEIKSIQDAVNARAQNAVQEKKTLPSSQLRSTNRRSRRENAVTKASALFEQAPPPDYAICS